MHDRQTPRSCRSQRRSKRRSRRQAKPFTAARCAPLASVPAAPSQALVAVDVQRRTAIANIAGEDVPLTFLTGFDDCILGVVEHFGLPQPIVLYDKAKIVASLIATGLALEQALEYFDVNIGCLWVGETTPAFAFLG